MKQLVTVKVASAVIAAFGLTAGMVGVVGAATGTIGTTGDDSENYVNATSATEHDVDVAVDNVNDQVALSGDATVEDNDDTAGSAGTGAAENEGTQSLVGGVTYDAADASADASATIADTGDDSVNTVDAHSDYNTHTSVTVTNNSAQNATSGNAVVSGNENGGSATTGDVKNTSTQSTTFNVQF